MKKIIAFVLCLIASGYVVDFGFWAMNQPSDTLYIGGMLAIVLWFMFMFICWRKILKEKNNESKQASGNGVVGSDSSNVVGMH